MLTTLAIFNSTSHAKAIIRFDKTGIQIVGENKIGKTTLINSLNFLYIIDREKMSFDSRAGRTTYTFKQSLDHFFPSHKQSFTIFECLKTKAGGYFCILVKRKASEEDVEYYKIDKQFEESDYLHSNGNMKNFEEIQKFFALENLIKKINDRKDLFSYIYSQDSKQNVFLWITDTVKRKGQSLENSFTKVYRFLLNASSVDNDSLKEALMIADEKSTRSLDVFVRKDKFEKIEKFKKDVLYLNKLKEIRNEFEELKLLANQTELKQKEFEKLLSYYRGCLEKETKNLQEEITQYELEISNQKKRKISLESQKYELVQNEGKLKGKLESLEQNKSSFEKQLQEIEQIIQTNPLYNTAESLVEFLKSREIELQKEYEEILSDLQSIEKYNFTQKEIEQKINQLKKEEKQLQTQIEKDGNLFIQHISEDKQICETLNAIFSKEILSQLTKDDILEKVVSLNDILFINEGKIKIEKIQPKRLESIEELKEKLGQTQKDLKQQNDILETIQNRTEKEEQSKKLKQEIETINEKIQKISKKEEFEKELAFIQNEIKDTITQLKKTEQETKAIVQEIKKLEMETETKEQKKQNKKEKIQEYKSWYSEFEEDFKNLFHRQEELEKEISLIEQRQNLKKLKKECDELNRKKEEKFRKLQRITENFSAEASFITQIQEEILSIEDKEKSIEALLEQVSHELIQPVQNFLGDYKQFETFLGNFNRKITNYKISDLSSLKIELKTNTKLYNDLEKISKIIRIDAKESLFTQAMSSEQQEYLKVLEEYVTYKNKEILFDELFDITLNAYDQNGNNKKIDLKKGNESQGTIRLINLILFLLVICYFKVSNPENKLVFFIDEDVMDSSNTEELLRFCKENDFVVIFAAKHIISGLEKYYFLKKYSEHQNKVFLDERHAHSAEKK